MSAHFDDLPDELLEHILSKVSPYHDLDSCKFVCKKWCVAMKRVVHRKKCNLNNAINTNRLRWEYDHCKGMSLRHSHAACCSGGTMYIYGGFSKNSTTFNDLLAFDLSKRSWKRIQSTGNFPSPKAGASMCSYKNKLIVYGGCAKPTNLQPLIVFGELHIFDILSNFWTSRANSNALSPPTTGHSVSVHRNTMIMYGGMNSHEGNFMNVSDTLYCLDLETYVWSTPRCSTVKPPPMFWQSQIFIDDDHLIIIGGRDKHGNFRPPNQGAWLLTMGEEPWQWRNLIDENPQWMPPRRWYQSITKVGDSLVSFCRQEEEEDGNNGVRKLPEEVSENIRQRPEENVNGRRGSFLRNQIHTDADTPQPGGPVRVIVRYDRRKMQLSLLEKYQRKYCEEKVSQQHTSPSMNLYVADIAHVIETGKVTWKEPRFSPGSPSARVLYTLITGKSELIMFGGVLAGTLDELNIETTLVPTNTLAIAMAPRFYL